MLSYLGVWGETKMANGVGAANISSNYSSTATWKTRFKWCVGAGASFGFVRTNFIIFLTFSWYLEIGHDGC